ncbi:hypothetical protein ACWC9U_15605 [Streptomyces sp. 900116325]
MQFQTVGFLLVERNRERSPVQSPGEGDLWDTVTAEHDPARARALALRADQERLFTASMQAMVNGLLATYGGWGPLAGRLEQNAPG